MKLLPLTTVATACLGAACSGSGAPENFYVVVAPTEAEQYYHDMIDLVAQHGLEPKPGSTKDPWGGTLYVVEGKGRGVRVWSVNALLTERQSRVCGGPNQTRNDPRQFTVRVSNWSLFRGDEVSAVTSELMAGLREKGYDVRTQHRDCEAPPGAQ